MDNIEVFVSDAEIISLPPSPNPDVQMQMYVNTKLKNAGIPVRGVFFWGGVSEGKIEVTQCHDKAGRLFRWRHA